MARFYGSVQGSRGKATRLGGASSGLTTVAAGWQGGVSVTLFDEDGIDMCHVETIPWNGAGQTKTLYRGPVCDQRAARRFLKKEFG